ncbi:MAG: GNAT family N-acetyltransferase [Alphaproteobacteria bacterium]|nr:GNAT family N-acetyltransferase [Alphaproteobacteria bacterium]
MLWAVHLPLEFETVSSFDFSGEDYAHLCAQAQISAFQHPIWLDAFYRHLVTNRGGNPLFLAARRPDTGALELMLPLILRRRYGIRLLETTDLGVSDYVAPVGTPAFWSLVEQMPAVRNEIKKVLPQFDLMRIRPVRDGDCHKFDLLFDVHPVPLGFSSHAVELDGPFDEWRKSNLNASFRKMIDRKRRKLQREHETAIDELKEPGAVASAIGSLAALRSGRFEGDIIQNDFVLAFYRDVAVRGTTEGFAGTWRMRAGDEDVGYVFGVTHGGRFYYLLIGCDYEDFGNYSPGLQMYDAIIKDWMEQGGTCFDFTIGDEDFKRKFGTTATPIYGFYKAGSLFGRIVKSVLERKHAYDVGRNQRKVR